MVIRIIILLALFPLSTYANMQLQTNQDTVITFSCGAPENSIFAQHLESAYKQVFQNLGYDFVMAYSSLARAIEQTKHGRTDGHCASIEGFEEIIQTDQLVKLNVVVKRSQFSAWSADANFKINDASEIRTQGLKVAFPRGPLINLKFNAEHNLTENLYPTVHLTAALKMLQSRRVDLVLAGAETIQARAETAHINQIYQAALFFEYESYPYLNKRLIALKPQIEQELSKLFFVKSLK